LGAQAGLRGAQRLADAMQEGAQSFRHLDAPQLLKHMLGLAIAAPGKASLYYLYYDCLGSESSAHRAEIEAFAEQVRPNIRFDWLSYQYFFARLRASSGDKHRPYLEYVTRRYRQTAS